MSYYYKQHNLDHPFEDYELEENKSKQNLLEILEECVETYNLSREIKTVLKEYTINLNDDNSSVDEVEENFENSIIIFEKEHGSQSTTNHTPECHIPQKYEYSKVLDNLINHSSAGIVNAEVILIRQDI